MAVIATEQLTKRYGRNRGIDDVTLSVESGEVFGFLGPNGAGKTTTIRTLLDFLHPTSGTASLFGLDSRRDSVAIRTRLGNLPGDFAYDPALTGRELLQLLAGLRGMESLGPADELAARFHADLDRPLRELSRGNRQKVGLVQALFHEPELVILDEPTSGLDPLMQEEFMRVVSEQSDLGTTVFLSSHALEEVQRVCHRVGIIRDGRLIAVEHVDELIGKAYRHVSLRFAEPVDAAEFQSLPGVSDLAARDGRITFKVSGDLDSVVKAAARHTLLDFELSRPTLEEVFLTYYTGGQE